MVKTIIKATVAIMFDKLNVLIIDDDVWISRVLQKIITNIEGISKIFVANNGFEGVAMAIKERPNLVFLDIMMPEIDGIQILKLLKTIEDTKKINVIMVSGNTDVNNFGMAINLGAADYISKPFTSEIIQKKLERLYKVASAD